LRPGHQVTLPASGSDTNLTMNVGGAMPRLKAAGV
jgi:hypothetical protein